MPYVTKKKASRTGIVALVLTIVLLGGVTAWAAWIANHYKTLVKNKLPGWIADATNGVYHVSLKDISINIITRRVTLSGVHLWPDTARVNELKTLRLRPRITTVEIELPKAEISGINWGNIIAKNEVGCKQVILWQAKGIITQIPLFLDSAQRALADSLKQVKRKSVIKKFSVGEIDLIQSEVKFRSTTKSSDSFLFEMRNCNVTLNDWMLKVGEKNDTSKFFLAKKGHVKLDSLFYRKQGLLYTLSTSGIDFQTEPHTLELKNLTVTTVVTKGEFYKYYGHQKEIYRLHFPSIALEGLSWNKLLNDNLLLAEKLKLEKPSIHVFMSRLPPTDDKSKMGNYPHQLLQQLELKVNIKKVEINGGDVVYAEVSNVSRQEGDVNFEMINGSISNVTNIDSLVEKNKICTVVLYGKLYHSSEMRATFKLLLPDTNGYFTVDATLKSLEAAQINNTTRALAMAEVKSFHVHDMTIHVEGNQYEGRGRFTIPYSDFKLELQKVDSSGDKRELRDKHVTSFLANNFVLYSDNPMPGDGVRSVSTYVKRKANRSFFSLIWENIYQGLEKTAVKNKKLEDIAKKTAKKKNFFQRLFGKKDK